MKTIRPSSYSAAAKEIMLRQRGEPLFLAGWRDAVFLHFAVSADQLQPFVPYDLDLHEGMAYVSCVAFTMRDMRPRAGVAWLLKPIATHEFLNVRTYVRHGDERGIYFLAEWLPNLLSVLLGPTVFGLPYQHGRLRYEHAEMEALQGIVEDRASGAALRYSAALEPGAKAGSAEAGSLDEFLLERYTAFTRWQGWKRLFRVWHPAWEVVPLRVELLDTQLLHQTGGWFAQASFVGAHFARGFDDIWMGRPRLCPRLHQTPTH